MPLTLSLLTRSHTVIDTAIERYSEIDNYQVTLRARSSGSFETIRYYFKKPGFVKMEFLGPHKETMLVYNPHTKKVRLRSFTFLKFFVLTFSPESRMLRSARGHRVDKSDIGALLTNVEKLLSGGTHKVLNKSTVGDNKTMFVHIQGNEGFSVGDVHRYELWLDRSTFYL